MKFYTGFLLKICNAEGLLNIFPRSISSLPSEATTFLELNACGADEITSETS